MLKACLFDLDGVIVDTAHFHYMAWRQLANRLGFEFTREQNEALKGISRMESLAIVLAVGEIEVDETTQLAYAAEKNTNYLELCNKLTPTDLLPGVASLITNLRNSGIQIGLGSVSKNAPLILDRLEITDWFDVIIDGNQIQKGKPDPEVFLKGAQALGVPPTTCIVFEDAVAGIAAGVNAGMRTVGIGDPQSLAQADWVVGSLEEVHLEQLQQLI